MRSRQNVSIVEYLLVGGPVLAVVLAIVTGILGMHVLMGTQAAPPMHAGMNSVVAPSVEVPLTHISSSHAVSAEDTAAERAVPVQPHPLAAGNCMPSPCEASMTMQGSCASSVGAAAVVLPLPRSRTRLAAPAGSALTLGYKSSHRDPDPPSLNQLSISRT